MGGGEESLIDASEQRRGRGDGEETVTWAHLCVAGLHGGPRNGYETAETLHVLLVDLPKV